MKDIILKETANAVLAALELKKSAAQEFIAKTAHLIAETFNDRKKLLIAGNGGSLCDAMHFAEELTGYFRGKRKALPALVLSEPGHLTCVGNDVGYEHVFQRGVEAFGQPGDLFIALSTSGNSQNLVLALETAKERKLKTISFLGKTGGKMKGMSDLEWIVENFSTSDRVQEAHMSAIHIIIHCVEVIMFSKESLGLKQTQNCKA